MISSIIHRLLLRRHFWRHATFSEIAELYASRLMTVFALRFVLVFSSVYLYKLDYGVATIAWFWAAYFGLKIIFVPVAALITARRGPKHGVFYANIMFAVALSFLYGAGTLGVAAVIVWCVLQAFAAQLNNLSYAVDFSKVKHSDHAGKELGYMNIIEKVASSISPLIGGAIATLYAPTTTMIFSVLLFLVSSVPLLRTAEPTQLHQRLSLKGYPWQKSWRSLRANIGVGADVFASGIAWVMYITVIVFAGDGNEIYVKVGVLASLGLVVALTASYVFGRLIDHRQGLLLLRTSVVANALVHLLRPTVVSPLGIVVSNTANDTATTGYSMAFTRGTFDLADTPGYRIVYLSFVEVCANIGAGLGAISLAALLTWFGSSGGLSLFFVAVAFATLSIAGARFPLYKA